MLSLALPGCSNLGEPEIADLWTRLDLAEAPSVDSGTGEVRFVGQITYRRVITGSVIAEIRISDLYTAEHFAFDPDTPREDMLRDVERLLAGSTSLGGVGVLVTGWDHLVQRIPLAIEASLPQPIPDGAFLVLYFGEVEEVEMASGETFDLFIPAAFTEDRILPIAFPLGSAAGSGEETP